MLSHAFSHNLTPLFFPSYISKMKMVFAFLRADERALRFLPRGLCRERSKPRRYHCIQRRLMPVGREQKDDLSRLTPVNGKESEQMTQHNVF